VTLPVPGTDLTVVTALCSGYTSEVVDLWAKQARQTIFALYDPKSLSVSLRRSPDCEADLSSLAQVFGGGGHAAAAGCHIPELHRRLAEELGRLLARAVRALHSPDAEKA
jgi:nanoRNase/pAp phosphatase (c-di-AMP/oligoRNAs hydrolase)